MAAGGFLEGFALPAEGDEFGGDKFGARLAILAFVSGGAGNIKGEKGETKLINGSEMYAKFLKTPS